MEHWRGRLFRPLDCQCHLCVEAAILKHVFGAQKIVLPVKLILHPPFLRSLSLLQVRSIGLTALWECAVQWDIVPSLSAVTPPPPPRSVLDLYDASACSAAARSLPAVVDM